MIHTVEGDILLTKAQVIAHGVAPNDHFDQGLALSLRKEWPAMVKDFRHWCHVHHPKAGGAWTWGGVGGARIVNLLTQDEARDNNAHPGKASLHNVRHALKELRKTVEKEGFESVALPRLATGVGGLEWTDVKPIIEEQLGDLGVPVYVYETFHAGQQATEPQA